MVFVRSTALAETYESRFSTKERCTLEELAKEKERQKALQDYVTNTPKPNHNTRVITDRPREGGRTTTDRPPKVRRRRRRTDGFALPRYHGCGLSSYAETVSAAKTPPKKGVSVTNYPVEPKSDRGEAGWATLRTRIRSSSCRVRLCHVSCGDDCTSVTRS